MKHAPRTMWKGKGLSKAAGQCNGLQDYGFCDLKDCKAATGYCHYTDRRSSTSLGDRIHTPSGFIPPTTATIHDAREHRPQPRYILLGQLQRVDMRDIYVIL
ncbi:uncharacterized protein [Temnothorax nylanderi]|uniref:uncharacterized protein isoform X2 n=1 Tax=Temnothorax nylanderi TaxID=102681 RepID=UPI003A842C49